MSGGKLVPFVRDPDKAPDVPAEAMSVEFVLTPQYVDELLTGMANAAINGAIAFLEAAKVASAGTPMPINGGAQRGRNRTEPEAEAEYMDEKELCSKLGISSVTATKWRAKAEGPPFVKLANRMIRYKRSDVDAWLAASRK